MKNFWRPFIHDLKLNLRRNKMHKSPGPNRGLWNPLSFKSTFLFSSTNLLYLLFILNFFLLDLDFSQAVVSKFLFMNVSCVLVEIFRIWNSGVRRVIIHVWWFWQMICAWILRVNEEPTSKMCWILIKFNFASSVWTKK